VSKLRARCWNRGALSLHHAEPHVERHLSKGHHHLQLPELGDFGLEMIEEKARSELGMVKPDEVFVQVSPKR